jgi:hypothetical protein
MVTDLYPEISWSDRMFAEAREDDRTSIRHYLNSIASEKGIHSLEDWLRVDFAAINRSCFSNNKRYNSPNKSPSSSSLSEISG